MNKLHTDWKKNIPTAAISGPMEPQEYDLKWGDINELRLDNNFEVNLTLGYSFTSKDQRWTSDFTFSVTNVFGNSNQFNRSYFLDRKKNRPTELKFVNYNNLFRTMNAGVVITFK